MPWSRMTWQPMAFELADGAVSRFLEVEARDLIAARIVVGG
jgi:hypothetical protein